MRQISTFQKLIDILSSFLGDYKQTSDVQLQFNCPQCALDKGVTSDGKHNLEVNLAINKFNCWSCGEVNNTHGSIFKLISKYGSPALVDEYKKELLTLKSSNLYKLPILDKITNSEDLYFLSNDLSLPFGFTKIKDIERIPKRISEYLKSRNITNDIINEYNIGYTLYNDKNLSTSSRIIIPSFDEFGELNYWVGRDYTNLPKRMKYMNPKVDKKSIIFNEKNIQWDADITLVEGPFDSIVVPNSIPLLGKILRQDFKLFQTIFEKCNANINIFLDGDAYENVKVLYKTLNIGKLYKRIKYIPTKIDLDPSKIHELYGKKGIIEHLRNASEIEEYKLL